MLDISRKTYEINYIETNVDNNGTLWLNEKHKEEVFDHKHLRKITTKYNLSHRKQRYELIEEQKKQVDRISIEKKLAIKVIMDCRTVSADKFKT